MRFSLSHCLPFDDAAIASGVCAAPRPICTTPATGPATTPTAHVATPLPSPTASPLAAPLAPLSRAPCTVSITGIATSDATPPSTPAAATLRPLATPSPKLRGRENIEPIAAIISSSSSSSCDGPAPSGFWWMVSVVFFGEELLRESFRMVVLRSGFRFATQRKQKMVPTRSLATASKVQLAPRLAVLARRRRLRRCSPR